MTNATINFSNSENASWHIFGFSIQELSRNDAAIILWRLRSNITKIRNTHSVSMDKGYNTTSHYVIEVNPYATLNLITESRKSTLAKLYVSLDCKLEEFPSKRKVSNGCI